MSANHEIMSKARRHLSRRDPLLKGLITKIGPCTLWFDSNHFGLLVRSIVSQQISSKAARSIFARLEQTLGSTGIAPAGILSQREEALRAAGLSAAKVRSVRDLAAKVQDGTVPLTDLPGLSDEEVIERLVLVRGIGRWTAEMFLIFSLGRLDILPVGDLGLRVGVQKLYELPETPVKARLIELAEPWRPYRSVATWYFWRSLGGVPQSDPK
jgi:DNA-3-methyladenine glycosylase II